METFLNFTNPDCHLYASLTSCVWCFPSSLVSSVWQCAIFVLLPFWRIRGEALDTFHSTHFYVHYQFIVHWVLYNTCSFLYEKKILKIRKIFCIFDSFFKKAWHIYFKCINEDLTLHQMGCFFFLFFFFLRISVF